MPQSNMQQRSELLHGNCNVTHDDVDDDDGDDSDDGEDGDGDRDDEGDKHHMSPYPASS